MLGALCAFGQEALNPPVPLNPTAVPTISPGANALDIGAALRAQELGFDTIAAGLYRDLLDSPQSDRNALTLALATVLLDGGHAAQAEQALQRPGLPHDAAWHLRAGLAAAQQRRMDVARGELSATKSDDLGPSDRAWWYFLQGMVVDASPEPNAAIRAGELYIQAEARAPTALARARIQLAHEQARLRIAPATDAAIENARQNMERFRGRGMGYDFARLLAVMLDSVGRKSRAMEVLQEQLRTLPMEERARADDFRLLMGLVGGAADGAGRTALLQLVEAGTDAMKQRMALQLLATASIRGPARVQFRAELDRLLAANTPPPIYEELLLFRAQLSLGAKTAEGYRQAEDDAQMLLQRFPGSPLRAYGYGILTSSAWENKRYRLAADYAARAREALPVGSARAELGVLVAEAWFRAGRESGPSGSAGTEDFRNSADAYAAAQREPPPGTLPGDLLFQRVLAEIGAGALDRAEPLVDELDRNPASVENGWQAEWNLARALQASGKTAEAYARVSRLLTQKPAAIRPELRARLAWLEARLSFDAGQPEQTLRLVAALQPSLDGLNATMKTEISSTAALLGAEADFSLKRDAAAVERLNILRREFPKTDAAAYSYIIEAEHYAQQDKIVDAQQLLTRLADDFPDNKTYAPYALYQAAVQAERRGQLPNYEEANKLIERLIAKYPGSNLVFYARLKQGALLEKLNQYAQAQTVFESLGNNFAQHQDVILAQLALAECHDAQSASDPSHAEIAQVLFEHLLYDRSDAPIDVRVEAGFNLGAMLATRGNRARATEVWWKGVVYPFLLAEPKRAAELGPNGRYWMVRTLLGCGEIFEKQENLDEAKNAWLLILRSGLPGATLARQHLARFNLPEGSL